MSDGASPARMAVYRSAEQVPRYRFFGDPPLEETDAVATKACEWIFSRIVFFGVW